MKKTWMVAWKSLLEMGREPLLSLLLLLFPALLIGVYYLAFGQTNQGLALLLRIMVKNEDRGMLGAGLVSEIQRAAYEGKPVFEVSRQMDERSASTALREGKSALLLVIPPDFSAVLEGMKGGSIETPTVTFVGDLSSDNYSFAVSFLEDLVQQYGRRAQEQANPAEVNYSFIPGTGTMSDFQYGVPGVIVFGVMFLIVSTATLLVRETSHRTLRRLRLSGTGAFPILAGVTLAQMAAALLQIAVAWGAALAFGFRSPGSLALATCICLLLSLAAVGLGLVTASFARNDGEAVNLATGLLVPLVFLSGTVFPMPIIPLVKIGSQVVQVFDFFPTAHAAEALRRVLVFGEGPASILYPLFGLALSSAIYLAAGILIYQKMRLERTE